jgi:hypothetical protein
VREFRSSCFRRRSRHDVVDVESRFLTCLEQGRHTRNRSPARSSTAWQDPVVPARPETDAVLGPPAQKGVPSYKVVVEGD